MQIGESFFLKNHGKLAHLRILAPKIFHENNCIHGKRNDFSEMKEDTENFMSKKNSHHFNDMVYNIKHFNE